MQHFFSALALSQAQRAPANRGRRWLYVPYDQLSDGIGPLAREPASELGIVLVEAPAKAARRPYHRQKLLAVLTSMRHFALEQAARGVAVRYVVSAGSYADALGPLARELGPLRVMEPAEYELRADFAPLVARGLLEVVPHEGWLTTRALFREAAGAAPPWRMDAFYRGARRACQTMVDAKGKPEGGRWSFDTENRQPWRGAPPAPALPTFAVDAITEEVCALLRDQFSHHPGELHPEAVPATRADVEALWAHALAACLPHFGPYEDAMSRAEPNLFHTRISVLLNLHRLLPARVVADVATSDLPLASREGFVRQVLGWREYMHHVHALTDGFRAPLASSATWDATRPPTVAAVPGDGGYARWAGAPWPAAAAEQADGGAVPTHLGAAHPLPTAYWGVQSGLACLDIVVRDVWREGYSHHITRLMVLANLAQLLDLSPRELTDWFWVAYIDAYDWVVESNVLAMGTFALGDLATTKPYISGAAYIDRMSDYCRGCQFDPATDCPITRLYWAYLARHEPTLSANPRIGQVVRGLSRRSAEDRAADVDVFTLVRATLDAGAALTPADLAPFARAPRKNPKSAR